MKKQEEVELKDGAEFEKEFEGFGKYETVFVSVEGGVLQKRTALLTKYDN